MDRMAETNLKCKKEGSWLKKLINRCTVSLDEKARMLYSKIMSYRKSSSNKHVKEEVVVKSCPQDTSNSYDLYCGVRTKSKLHKNVDARLDTDRLTLIPKVSKSAPKYKRERDAEKFLNLFYEAYTKTKLERDIKNNITLSKLKSEKRDIHDGEMYKLFNAENIVNEMKKTKKRRCTKDLVNIQKMNKYETLLGLFKNRLLQKRNYSQENISYVQKANISIFQVQKEKFVSKKDKMKLIYRRKLQSLQPQKQPPFLSSLANIITHRTIFPQYYPIGSLNLISKYTNPTRTKPVMKSVAQRFIEQQQRTHFPAKSKRGLN